MSTKSLLGDTAASPAPKSMVLKLKV